APPSVPAPLAPPASPTRTPPSLAAAVAVRLSDARFGGTTVGLSVWMDGYGEVVAHNADLALTPASTQKLFTAVAALAALGPDAHLQTAVRAHGVVTDGLLHGDLVLVGGGDPSLRRAGAHSLDVLAAQVRAAGIHRVTGDLVGDESRYDEARTAAGWFDWHVPGIIGPLSALTVDANRHRRDADYVADPVVGNLRLFRAALAGQGVAVDGGDVDGRAAPGGAVVASLRSAPLASLVADMLTRSDNLAAELLLKEVGVRRRGVGSTAAGVDAAAEALRELGLSLRGTAADGSGLSRHDRRSPREWRKLLQAAVAQPWGRLFVAGLPVAGRTGTLASRFRGTPLEGTLRAKTGRILEGRALSGYLTTAGGRGVVFSVVVNGTTPSSPVVGAIDDLVQAIAADTS
ncbi:MAG: D-alanyl-D-alanine carboxypeptidase/D-alanyl-D-alanine-endopeptidase, partial [Actinomycetota bacterium]|nr:D-alanyl-D-alanine carboxypeptidase/D-alanyl-D-alanine-endopeptidase [Actinomycetota bacterium]